MPRSGASNLVMLSRGSPDAPRATAHTVDVGVDDFRVDGPADLEVNEIVWFVIDLGGGGELVGGRARVVRAERDGSRALHIERIPLRDHELLIRHVLGSDGADPNHAEARSFPRVWATRRVALTVGEAQREPISAQTLNISAGGVLLVGAPQLPIGERVWLRFDVSQHGPTVNATGRIVREGLAGTKGVAFEEISARDQELVARYCALHHHD